MYAKSAVGEYYKYEKLEHKLNEFPERRQVLVVDKVNEGMMIRSMEMMRKRQRNNTRKSHFASKKG